MAAQRGRQFAARSGGVLDEHDPRGWPGFATCVAIYELWGTAWAVGVSQSRPDLVDEAAVRVRCLRDQTCEPWTLR